jgi:N-sulfoglucosamine sulfohydrolase
LPTLLDVVGVPHPSRMDGRSFAPLLRGESQTDRDFIVAEYNENVGGHRNPMRAIITKDYGYLFNPWSNRSRTMVEPRGGVRQLDGHPPTAALRHRAGCPRLVAG